MAGDATFLKSGKGEKLALPRLSKPDVVDSPVEDFQLMRRWLKKLPWRAKPRLLCERALKTVPETGVKSDLAFCLGSLNEKTNSGL